MHFLPLLVPALAAFASGLSIKNPKSQSSKNVVEGAYIIQLKPGNSLSGRSDTTAHDAFHKRAAASELDYTIRRNFTKPVTFYGLSINVHGNLTDPAIQSKLAAMDGVENVWPVVKVSRNAPAGPQRSSKSKSAKSENVEGRSTAVSSTSSASTGENHTLPSYLIPPKVTGTANVLSPFQMSGIDKLHALGIKGSGMKIGIIDTGVDYRHPSLGGGFGSGYKIAGGHAYRDDAGDSVSTDDPLTTCVAGGHGTHVSGIIGMQDPDNIGFGLVGVAPEAEIYMYRVFPCTDDSAWNDDIIAAMDKAHTDGVDVVSISLGQDNSWDWDDPFETTTTALVAEGIAVVAAAGNDGEEGLFVPAAPGTGPDVISVGCIDNTDFPTTYTATDSKGRDVSYASVWPYSGEHDVYVLGGTGSGCNASEWEDASSTVTDKNGTIIVFHYDWDGSDCEFSVREDYWAEYDFSYIMTYVDKSSDPYAQQHVLLEQSDNTTLYSNLLPEEGLSLAASYASAGGYGKYKLTFNGKTVSSVSMKTGGAVSYFSSFGPDWEDLELKPQLSAPGASFLSTWPLGFNAGYAVIRGTSMATPLVAASYALLKSEFPSLSVAEIRALLQSTSTPTSSAYYPELLATTVQQGAGLINTYNAYLAANSTAITPTQFAIGDTDDYTGSKISFTVTNNAATKQTYTVSHTGAAMMYFRPYGFYFEPFVPETAEDLTQPEYKTYATVEFPLGTKFTVAPGSTQTVEFVIDPPSDIDETKVPVISGFIKVSSSLGATYNLPYEGLPYSRWDAKYFDTGSYSLNSSVTVPWPTIVMYNDDTDTLVNYYSGSGIMVLDKDPIILEELAVGPLYNTLQPSWNVRAELLAANTTFKPDIYGYDPNVTISPLFPVTESYRNVMEDGVTPTYGLQGDNPGEPYADLIDFPEMTVISDSDEWDDEGGEAPTDIGDYRLLLSVLKWGGNVTNWPEDWETWLSPVLRIIDSGD
ncbi:Minor extracellular protease vpr [Cytospora mali]|uniref:Minor extracellular protease vpr n=1 Tax=Cytospora mali TaxID=578113 RepID=A0A194VWD1_CYTMA|nr:Minor extracellular protease vpr [Valsa mali]